MEACGHDAISLQAGGRTLKAPAGHQSEQDRSRQRKAGRLAWGIALAVLGLDLLLRERIGCGTVIDALLTGNSVQMFSDLNPFPLNSKLWLGVLLMLIGFVFMALGMWVYMRAQQGCGPRDSLLVGLGKRLPKVPIGVVEILLWAVVLLCGWLLGGPVGIGTLISTFGAGAVMQLVYNLLRFEPRTLRHRSLLEILRVLMGKS